LEVEPEMKVAHFEVICHHAKSEYFWTSGWLGVVFLSLESFGYWKNLMSTRVAAASARCTPLSAACFRLHPARLPPPRGTLHHPTPHLPLRRRQQHPPEALTGVVLRSVTYHRGAAPVVSPFPSFASNGFTHCQTRSRVAFPAFPRHRFNGLTVAPPPSRHGGISPVLGVGCQPMDAASPLGWARPTHPQKQLT
jgi:hypothetical protein